MLSVESNVRLETNMHIDPGLRYYTNDTTFIKMMFTKEVGNLLILKQIIHAGYDY